MLSVARLRIPAVRKLLTKMSAYATTNGANGANGHSASHAYTVTNLKRWSCDDKQLPSVQSIRSIHIYDFDNTLFASPLPNRQIWHTSTIGQLSAPDVFVNGGWWHDSTLLAATGEGLEKEEARAWKGWWNEQIVQLVELTMEQKDALNVLLTGRSDSGFASLIKRMVKSKGLEFDMVCLKPAVGPANQRITSTMQFKQELLKDIIYTYREAEDLRIYEDRPNHVIGFRDFFVDFNKTLQSSMSQVPRNTISAEVIPVAEKATRLDPVIEVAEIQRMMNGHNQAVRDGIAPLRAVPLRIARNVLHTAYMVDQATTERLLGLYKIPKNR